MLPARALELERGGHSSKRSARSLPAGSPAAPAPSVRRRPAKPSVSRGIALWRAALGDELPQRADRGRLIRLAAALAHSRQPQADQFAGTAGLRARRTLVTSLRGARATRATSIRLVAGALLAEVVTEWVWVRASDGQPARLPRALIETFSGTDEASPGR